MSEHYQKDIFVLMYLKVSLLYNLPCTLNFLIAFTIKIYSINHTSIGLRI